MLDIWKSYYSRIQQRWVFAIMGFWSVVIANSMKSCLSLTITQMVFQTNITEYSDDTCTFVSNLTTSITPRNIAAGIYDWDEKLQGLILSSFFWGYIITQIPSGLLAEKFGGKYTLGVGILSTAILTLLVPLAIDTGGSTALIILRFLMGLGDGMNLPSAIVLLSRWAPPSERSKMGTLVFSGSAIGAMVGGGMSGLLMHYSPLGWRSVFYIYGSSGVIWFFAWILLCYNNPDEHPFISENEKKFLYDAMSETTHKNTPPTPWRHIIRSVPFWALVISLFGQDWGCFTLASDLPKYMSNVLKFSVRTNGLLLGLASFIAWISSFVCSCVADWMINRKTLSMTNVRKSFTSLGTLGMATSLVAASYAGCDRTLAVVFFIMAMAFIGTMVPGMRVNPLDLSPNYSGTLLALASTINASTGILTPYIVGILAPNQTALEWRLVFWIVFIVLCSTNLVCVIWSSAEVQYWNDPEFLINEREERRNKTAGEAHPKLTITVPN